MMEYLRMFLIFLRKQDNKSDLKVPFIYTLMIICTVSIVAGVIFDLFIPFNFFTNMLRGSIAVIAGFSMASSVYLLWVKYKRRKTSEDRHYQPIRKRFSFRQRVNISIVLGTIIGLYVLLTSKPSPTYSLKASVLIMTIILLLCFSRRGRDEFLKDIYNIPDIRDLEFMKKSNEFKQSHKNSKERT